MTALARFALKGESTSFVARAAVKTAVLQLFCFLWIAVDLRGVIYIPRCQNVWSSVRVCVHVLLKFAEVCVHVLLKFSH